MNAGFISPSFRMLEVNWQHDFEMVKLGVPTFMSFLYRAGHKELAHWDFDAQVCDAIEADPTAFDIKQYFDAAKVSGFLDGSDDALRAQTEKLLDTLGVYERKIFGISLSAVLDRIANVVAIAATGQCMAKVLKERYPSCTIVFGGLQVNPDSLHEGYYRRFMEACPYIDYSLLGRGDEIGVQLYRNIWRGEHVKNQLLDRVLYRSHGDGRSDEKNLGRSNGVASTVVLAHRPGSIEIMSLDPDLALTPKLNFESHHRAHTKAGAAEQAESVIESATALATIPVTNLVKKHLGGAKVAYEVTHNPDGTEIAADVAGAFEYETIPARVPIFDPALVDAFRYSGQQIMKRFHFNKEHLLRFSRFENDRIVVLPHIFVKGCNAPCGFCSYAYKSIEGEDVIQTVEGLKFLSETYDCKHFHFLNTQINSVYQYCESFCDAIVAANLKIFWSDCCNMRSLDEKLLDKIRAAGGMRLVYGIEAPEDEMLKYIHKGITVAKIERLMKAAHERGIWNHCLLIAGMPHETVAKQDRMMDFFRRTAEHIDFYTVSSFYLIASSPWGEDPEKFGIDRTSSPDLLLEEQAFNEKADGRWTSDNLKWPEKKQQIIDSTKRFYKTISGAKGHSRCVGGNIDLYLLMYLYSTLGHDGKAEIRKIYEETARYINPSLRSSENGADSEQQLPPECFRINFPVIVGRANEADQSSLIQVPVTLVVSRRDQGRPHFCGSQDYTLEYKTPRIFEGDDRFSRDALLALKQSLPETMGQLGKALTPFLRSVELRFHPESAARMAELLVASLPRFKPFAEYGYTVIGNVPPPTSLGDGGRTQLERMLQWNGLQS